jgi:thioredoxin 1
MASDNVVDVTVENFEKEVLNHDKLVLVDFWAEWCGPCKMLAPVLDEIAEAQKEIVKVCKVNVDKQAELAAKYGVRSIPTVHLFKAGESVTGIVGNNPKTYYIDKINLHK